MDTELQSCTCDLKQAESAEQWRGSRAAVLGSDFTAVPPPVTTAQALAAQWEDVNTVIVQVSNISTNFLRVVSTEYLWKWPCRGKYPKLPERQRRFRLVTMPSSGGRPDGASGEWKWEEWKNRAEKQATPSVWEEEEEGQNERVGQMEGWDREEEREVEGTGRKSSWPMERLRFCWPLGGRNDVKGSHASCWCKSHPSTNLWVLNVRVGSPILCRRGIKVGAAGERSKNWVCLLLFWSSKRRKFIHGETAEKVKSEGFQVQRTAGEETAQSLVWRTKTAKVKK